MHKKPCELSDLCQSVELDVVSSRKSERECAPILEILVLHPSESDVSLSRSRSGYIV